MTERFSIIEDPCGAHFIWDEHKLEPVVVRDQILAFATEAEARRALVRLRGRGGVSRPIRLSIVSATAH